MFCFYRAMHYSANRGLAIACPSVTSVDCDHIGWTFSKIISRLVSLGCSRSADPNIRGLLQGEHPEIWTQSDPSPQLIWASETFDDFRSQIAADWLQIAQRSQWRAYRKLPSLFRMVPSLTPTTSPSPKMVGPYAPRYANGHISATAHTIYLCNVYRVVIFAIAQLSCSAIAVLLLLLFWIFSRLY